MNPIFRYNSNAKYSTKDLKGGYNSTNFSFVKGPSGKAQLLNIL